MSGDASETGTRIVSESEFSERVKQTLGTISDIGWTTGPGRSGAVAAVYASHFLRVPFVPFGAHAPAVLGRPLVIDTARFTGRTLRKAAKRYEEHDPLVLALFEEPPRVKFWYETLHLTAGRSTTTHPTFTGDRPSSESLDV